MTLPGPPYPDQYPRYTITGENIDEVFDGETWRAVVRDGTTDPHFAVLVPEGSPFKEIGIEGEQILSFVVELAGQGNTDWVTVFPVVPPMRILDSNLPVEF